MRIAANIVKLPEPLKTYCGALQVYQGLVQ